MLLELYVGKVRKYNYVTPSGKQSVGGVPKKGIFDHPADVYGKAGVTLLTLNGEDLKRVKARQQDVVEAPCGHAYLSLLSAPQVRRRLR